MKRSVLLQQILKQYHAATDFAGSPDTPNNAAYWNGYLASLCHLSLFIADTAPWSSNYIDTIDKLRQEESNNANTTSS